MPDIPVVIDLPPRLREEVQAYIKQGWALDLNSLVIEALRRYLESHKTELTEHFFWRDVEWGLKGNE